ncbi:Nicalin, variant 2 [Balamuthia mandrillaris]
MAVSRHNGAVSASSSFTSAKTAARRFLGLSSLLLFSFCLLFLSLLEVSEGVHLFEVYRMIQYDTAGGGGGAHGGSRAASLSLEATTLSAADIARKLVVVPLEALKLSHLDRLSGSKDSSSSSSDASIGGLLVLLPSSSSPLSSELVQRWTAVERELIARQFKCPVYFAYADEELLQLYHALSHTTAETKLGEEAEQELSAGEGFFSFEDSYRLIVSTNEPAPLKTVTLTNIQGWLAGTNLAATGEETTTTNNEDTNGQTTTTSSSSGALPTIAVVTYYDTLAAAPELAVGADDNGSGVVALLELTRLFSRVYSGMRTRGRFNLLFVLTSGGRLNYAGTKHWLEGLDSRLLSSIDFALCLDSLSQGDQLYMHVSRPPKDPKISQLFQVSFSLSYLLRTLSLSLSDVLFSNDIKTKKLKIFNSTSASMDVAFELVHKKINISSSDVWWEHEQFSRQRVVAATLSHHSKALRSFERSNILDRSYNIKTLERNIRIIAESLAKYIFSLPSSLDDKTSSIDIFGSPFSLSAEYIRSWSETISSFPRFAPFLRHPQKEAEWAQQKQNHQLQVHQARYQDQEIFFYPQMFSPLLSSDLILALERELRDNHQLSDVGKEEFVLAQNEVITVYDGTTAVMAAHKVKPLFFELLLSVAVVSYLAVLYAAIKGPQQAFRQLKALI